jgi:hypothetical protein
MFDLLAQLLCMVVLAALLIGALLLVGRRASHGPRTTNPYVRGAAPTAVPTADSALAAEAAFAAPLPVGAPASAARSAEGAPAAPMPAPAAPPRLAGAPAALGLADFAAFDRLVARWEAGGRLSPTAAFEVRELIAAEAAALAAPPVAAPLATPAAPVAPPLAPDHAAAPPPPPRRSALSALGAALLSLDTRRVLLFLGAFLLVMSSLTLVVFSWSSLPALAQLGILAGTAAGLWAGGAWMNRRPELAAAGRNLQAVAALLMPVVGFALGRPGLFGLEPRPAWLLTSALSLAAYLLAAWRTGRAFYSGAAAVAALSALLAALGGLTPAWQLVPALLLLAALLPLSRALRSAAPGLAAGPRLVALAAAPLVALAAAGLYLADVGAGYAFGASLGASALFCALAYLSEARRPWLWAAIGLAPLALLPPLVTAGAGAGAVALTLGLVALLYLAVSEPAAARHAPAAWPLLAVALALGGLGLLLALGGPAAARLALPPLVALGAGLFALVEAGRLRWAGVARTPLAAGGLGAGAALLFGWLVVTLERAGVDLALVGIALLPLAAIAFAGAGLWPGRRLRAYDLALQAVAGLIALCAGGLALSDAGLRLPAALLLALILGGQGAARRSWPWAALSLGCGALAAAAAVERFAPPAARLQAATLAALALAAGYSLAGAALRRTALRSWTWPAVGWGALAGLAALGLAGLQLAPATPLAVGALLGLAALLGAHTALWRRPELGYGAGPLLVLAVSAATLQGFFVGWDLAAPAYAYVACALALAMALVGQALRPFGKAYARPYEHVAFVLLPVAPLLAGGSAAHLAVTWGALALLYAAALWRYRVPWAVAFGFLSLDMALLHSARLLWPGGEPARAGLLIVAAVWAQALASVMLRRFRATWGPAGLWGYGGAALGAALALGLAMASSGHGAVAAAALAALLALLVWVEDSEPAAWAAFGLAVLAVALVGNALGLAPAWVAAWLTLAQVPLCLAGWAAERAGLGHWRRPTTYGPLAAAALAAPLALLLGGALPPLTFALASLGLLLVTAAVRERKLGYAYLAGAAFVGATLSQLADWGFREPQWYVIPAGLYLLALAGGLRRFQGRRRASQLVEAAAVVLLLAVTFVQAVMPDGGLAYSLLLFAESLALVAYGALLRLRTPFLGGAAFFVAGVAWMTVDSVQLANQWVLLGVVGLLMVAAYVILERHQERLVRAGRQWAAELRSWG